jgi:hypothetical protein
MRETKEHGEIKSRISVFFLEKFFCKSAQNDRAIRLHAPKEMDGSAVDP